MKHLTPTESVVRHVLRRARTVAIVGASPSPDRHSHAVAQYLHHAGYDVIPVRPDRADVGGLPSVAQLGDVPGPVDVVVLFRSADAVVPHIAEAAAKGVEAVWLQPGTSSAAAEAEAKRHGLTFIKDLCIMEEDRRLSGQSGHPEKWGVHVRRRKATYADNRLRPEDRGYSPDGGGGHVAGGGGRSVLDEKKMVSGAPSPRHGSMKPKPR